MKIQCFCWPKRISRISEFKRNFISFRSWFLRRIRWKWKAFLAEKKNQLESKTSLFWENELIKMVERNSKGGDGKLMCGNRQQHKGVLAILKVNYSCDGIFTRMLWIYKMASSKLAFRSSKRQSANRNELNWWNRISLKASKTCNRRKINVKKSIGINVNYCSRFRIIIDSWSKYFSCAPFLCALNAWFIDFDIFRIDEFHQHGHFNATFSIEDICWSFPVHFQHSQVTLEQGSIESK